MDIEDNADTAAPPEDFLGFVGGLTIDEIARASTGRDDLGRLDHLRRTLANWSRKALGYDADPGQVALAAIELLPVADTAQRVRGLLRRNDLALDF